MKYYKITEPGVHPVYLQTDDDDVVEAIGMIGDIWTPAKEYTGHTAQEEFQRIMLLERLASSNTSLELLEVSRLEIAVLFGGPYRVSDESVE